MAEANDFLYRRLTAPKDLCNAEQNRTLPSIAAFFLLRRPMTSSGAHLSKRVRNPSSIQMSVASILSLMVIFSSVR
jgi:hypothetical protein